MKSNLKLIAIFLITIHSITGCKDDEMPPEVNVAGGEMLIANEGNFGWGEGTLSIYNEATKEVQHNVYEAKNNEGLGNVFNSINRIDGQYFFVMNNSEKIVVTDSHFVKTGEIAGLTSPRNIYKVGQNKAYVTDLYANAIAVIDLSTMTQTASIPCNGHSEEGVILDGKFWFTAPETSYIYGVDIATDIIVDSAKVGEKPQSIILRSDDVLIVLCQGDETKNIEASLQMIRLEGEEKSYTVVNLSGLPSSLTYDRRLDNLYYISDGIWKLDFSKITGVELWQELPNTVLYALEVNPITSEVYVSDVKDFTSQSMIYRYSLDGELIDQFTAGVIAGDFFFP